MFEFTDEEINALNDYVGSMYEEIKALLSDNVLLDIDFRVGYGQLITNIGDLDSLMQTCVNLYKAILKFTSNDLGSCNEVYRGVSKRQYEFLRKCKQMSSFVSTSINLKNILESYGNPLYDRKLLRIAVHNVPSLNVLEFYKHLLQIGKIDECLYYSSLGEEEVILLPFMSINNIEEKESSSASMNKVDFSDITLCPLTLELLSLEDEDELYRRIVDTIDEARVAHDTYFKDRRCLDKDDLQKYIHFKQLVIRYLKSKFAKLDLEFGYSRGGVLSIDGINNLQGFRK